MRASSTDCHQTDLQTLQHQTILISDGNEKWRLLLTPFELISHGLVNQLLFHRPLRSLDPARGRTQRASPFLLPTGDNGVLLLP